MTNNLKFRQIKAFTLAVENGSFRAAAQVLCITQPSFTALIKALEEDLGVELFERTTRRCIPTEHGQSFYQRVGRPLEDMEEAYSMTKEEGLGIRGRLAIATVPSLALGLLTDALGRFHRLYPEIRIFLSEHRSTEVISAVLENRVEIAIGRLMGINAELAFVPIGTDQLYVVAPKSHPILRKPVITWSEVSAQRFIFIGGGATELALRSTTQGASPDVEVTHMSTALSMVRQGLGLTVIPNSALGVMLGSDLGAKKLEGINSERELGIIYRRKKKLTVQAQRFIAIIKELPLNQASTVQQQ